MNNDFFLLRNDELRFHVAIAKFKDGRLVWHQRHLKSINDCYLPIQIS